ncbi:hypothetical protein LTR10_020396 [Elasticomyces elasticus]|uniref:SET domain-containing protein n=1 Tax=Exophiala sideris TaxID=1016849 RepID=A0ABR0JM23_9EURO|nr:hypothetical protein LTR10_020396 [Elasticomyces elasticus]KAK5036396.1 hypothetical protein LTS07_002123 [Exophiala sideris]KAK5041772.1 hypothetical protein LTR13_002439 [Exophiala sideris]KAK5066780.1 hypothetical protein LTR69_002127 [Exophiala sideris]KAK5184838.1 hypothetical protein LTR44_002684 [Eurotiomycetes sp. CCFEE 6388]
MAPRRSTRSATRTATNPATSSEPANDHNIINGPRVRKQTARYVEFKQSLKKSPRKQSKKTKANAAEIDNFMIRLYAEIHAAAINQIAQTDPSLTKILNGSRPSDEQGKKVVQQALNDLQVSHPERLVRFCKKPNLVILSICACSETFRTAIARSDADSKAEKEPLWGDLRPKLEKCASSLELFAKTRNLDWNSAMTACDTDVGYLLASVFQDDNNVTGIDQHTFGIGNGDVKEVHYPDNVPSHWILPQRRTKAQRPQFRYEFTEALDNHDFYGTEVPGNLNGASKPEIGDVQVTLQVNMNESIVVAGYDWPDLPAEANGDPRFIGYNGVVCQACRKEAKTSSGKTRATTRPACSCTFGDFCRQQDGIANPLLEIFDSGVCGAGVRALQPFKKDVYLGEYIGEIYPYNKDHGRYGSDSGAMYLFPLGIARASDFTATGRPKKSGTKKGRQQNATTEKDFQVDPGIFGNWTRYINHSCDPNTAYIKMNVGQKKRVFIQALRDIGFGEQITVSYGLRYFENLDLTCRCGSERCFEKQRQDLD